VREHRVGFAAWPTEALRWTWEDEGAAGRTEDECARSDFFRCWSTSQYLSKGMADRLHWVAVEPAKEQELGYR
jgi:hypothetical protein